MNKILYLTLVVLLVSNISFAQSSKTSQDDMAKKIDVLTDRITQLEAQLKLATFESILVKDPSSQASVLIQVEKGNPSITVFDKNCTKKIEIGISQLIDDSLISLYGDQPAKNVYLWRESCIPNKIDWAIVAMNAETNTAGYLSDKLVKTVFNSRYTWNQAKSTYEVSVQVNTETQPIWNNYLGTGRFSVSDREVKQAYQEAAAYVITTLGRYLDQVMPNGYSPIINFTIKGYSVGTWRDGEFTLDGE